jgi:hypothetical protein
MSRSLRGSRRSATSRIVRPAAVQAARFRVCH